MVPAATDRAFERLRRLSRSCGKGSLRTFGSSASEQRGAGTRPHGSDRMDLRKITRAWQWVRIRYRERNPQVLLGPGEVHVARSWFRSDAPANLSSVLGRAGSDQSHQVRETLGWPSRH